MAQIKECLEQANECLKLRNAAPISCICKSHGNKNCNCKKIACCKTKIGYKYVQPCRRDSCKPPTQNHRIDAPFADHSVYSRSYYPYNCEPRQKPIIQKDHIVMAGDFQDETVQRMSYQVQCVPVVQKIVPKDHCLKGQGPMKSMTTQQHDYYGQCVEREKKVVPRSNLGLFDCPMAKLTTTNFSYQPVCTTPVESYKPRNCYNAPTDDMDLNTVQRVSYKDVGIPEKPETPWAAKLEYCKPKEILECCTVYNYSFKEPGEYLLEDSCGNPIPQCPLVDDCCKMTCLADNAEERTKSNYIKAHHFNDDD